jgi:hypothetical protein
MPTLTESELAGIEQRAALQYQYGDTTALRAEDVAALVAEVRELWELRRHLVALHRQHLDAVVAGDHP